MDGKTAIFISDVHLGRGDQLDDFGVDNENAFARFLANQSTTYQNDNVDLVLLGDLLDIWQTASEEDKTAAESEDIDLNLTVSVETGRVDQIISRHRGFFDAVRDFAAGNPGGRRVVVVTGNHDHSLVLTDVQQRVRQAVTGGDPSLNPCVHFSNFYDSQELRVYAEHGNQYDKNNDYDNFVAFGEESPGYFFVRLFWNRLEPREPNLDNWQSYFQSILKRKLWNLILPAYELFSQYRKDSRPFERIDVPGVPFFPADAGSVPNPISGKPLPGSPDILFSDRGDPERVFSTDAAVENQLRTLYHDPGKTQFKEEIDRVLQKKYRGQPPDVPADHVASTAAYGLFQDDYVAAVMHMFASPGSDGGTLPLKNEYLSTGVYDYVLFGHTHETKEVPLRDLGVTYFNTGTWSTIMGSNNQNQSELCYVTIRKAQDGEVTASMGLWHL